MTWGKMIAKRIAETSACLDAAADVAIVTEPENASCAFLEAANDQPAEVGIPVKPRSDGYKPFDWGPADRRFERFRRCPDLLRSTGDTP